MKTFKMISPSALAMWLGFAISLTAFALPPTPAEGTGSTGGGNAVGDTLLDFYENQGSVTLTKSQIKNLPAYKEVVAPKIKEVAERLPEFASDLLDGFSKKWIMEPKELSKENCLNHGMLVHIADQTVVACQDLFEVRIFKPWFDQVALHTQGGIILHELVTSRTISRAKFDRENAEKTIREMVRTLFTIPMVSDTELQKVAIYQYFDLSKLPSRHLNKNFGYPPNSHMQRVRFFATQIHKDGCLNENIPKIFFKYRLWKQIADVYAMIEESEKLQADNLIFYNLLKLQIISLSGIHDGKYDPRINDEAIREEKADACLVLERLIDPVGTHEFYKEPSTI